MKKLFMVLFVCLITAVCFADDVIWTDAHIIPDSVVTWQKGAPWYSINPGYIENKEEVIRYFIESGDVCEIVGHKWHEIYSDITYTIHGNVFGCPQKELRQCGICGKKQEKKTAIEWFDIK